jgi:hypothetical protein
LGLIRTQELLAARNLDGAEQFFTRARDFGYSKSADETLAIWGEEAVLADVVWVIRKFRPDVIVTRFPPKGGDTHGHHTASAMLALKAFKAAADPAFHPEQLAHVKVWQARRIVWNKGVFNAKPGDDLSAFTKIDIGDYNPQLGLSYGELAATSRSMHKSQGFGAAPSRGTSAEYFQLLAGDPFTKSILDGIDTRWSRIGGGKVLEPLLARVRAQYKPDAPHQSIAALLLALGTLDALPENPYQAVKHRELVDLIAGCAGLWAEAAAPDFSVSPGGELPLTLTALNRSPASLQLKEIRLPGATIAVDQALVTNQPSVSEKPITIAPDARYSEPYWLSEPPSPGLYQVADPLLLGLPERPPALTAEWVVEFAAHSLSITRPIIYKWTDPVAGERQRPVEIVPPVTVTPASPVLMFPDARPRELRLVVKAGRAQIAGVVRPELPAGWSAEPASLPFELADKGSEVELTIKVRAPAQSGTANVRVVAELGAQKYARGLSRVEYPHIAIQTLFPPAEVKLVRLQLKTNGERIGYIAGAGDEVPAALRQAGYDVTVLDDEALRQPLGRYQTIVTGVRAFNTHPRLAFLHKTLMDWVAAGGTLVAQYNTNNRLSKAPTQIGPHPFEISQERVTDENAAVRLVLPEHPLLNTPNKIGSDDFAGWVQERGLYFAGSFAKEYQTPIELNDPGEPSRKGAILAVRHGKGAFIYTGLAFFRQLPAGVPGAYRLFANMVSFGRR